MKPSTPKGTRDFTPAQMLKRNHLFSILRKNFSLFGYTPIETPAMENLSTLTGKYGEEGDQLLFKVLNNGDYLKKADAEALEAKDSSKLTASIANRGLRYDLTVPFARFVVQHQNEISFPFKRYAIQPVWRADRPQKGRYQEFYQCDADVVGSESLVYEAELVKLYNAVFTELDIQVVIRINHRDVLWGLCEKYGVSDQFIDVVTSIDKFDKVGAEGVLKELDKRGITAEAAQNIVKSLKIKNLTELKALLNSSEAGLKGVQELQQVVDLAGTTTLNQRFEFDPTLARGLSYYTGCIFEVNVDTTHQGQESIKMGSIGGGGRYSNLTAEFGGKDLSGVGVSFGAERIFDVLNDLEKWPDHITSTREVLIAALEEDCLSLAFQLTSELRQAGISADCYPEVGKPKKPLRYADQNNINFGILIGEEERLNNVVTVKNLATREQWKIGVKDLAETMKTKINQ